MYLCKSQKILSPHNANPQSVTFAEDPANLTNYSSPQICRFAEDISGPPTFGREHRENEMIYTVTNLQLQFNPTTICPLSSSFFCQLIIKPTEVENDIPNGAKA
jgi:hypothetical protein